MSKKRNRNHQILLEMKKIYYPLDIQNSDKYLDWMGWPITSENMPSYHHIEKVSSLKSKNEYDGATIENGAYLGTQSHQVLHYIEQIDKKLYEAWNYVFLLINKMRCYPIDDIWRMIDNLNNITIKTIEENNERKTRR